MKKRSAETCGSCRHQSLLLPSSLSRPLSDCLPLSLAQAGRARLSALAPQSASRRVLPLFFRGWRPVLNLAGGNADYELPKLVGVAGSLAMILAHAANMARIA